MYDFSPYICDLSAVWFFMFNYGCWFWFVISQEGQKPSSIISAHLNVGSPIQPDASNGNTQVFVNGREITKVELRMLQVEN